MKGQMRIYLKTSHESLPRNRDSIANDEGRESSGGMMGVSATVSGPQRSTPVKREGVSFINNIV